MVFFEQRDDEEYEAVRELKELVEEGNVKYIGLSEAISNMISRAHIVNPITFVQIEWSLWTHDIEDEIVPLFVETKDGSVSVATMFAGHRKGFHLVWCKSFGMHFQLQRQVPLHLQVHGPFQSSCIM
ncbi:unnamed protein product [Vicia faba]|uniref:NADP-dependent oxidoreductase domain-containing protein n=1 Tax=Vicia faba TaxID=3906 RepID=A0AAV1AA14_VICFA|nr:unnamed protein product [Vicia faba]